jgi:nucleoside-diphosphate-sugar epimerase
MTSLITGANGYIGRKIMKMFSENNMAVLGCVRTTKQAEEMPADSVVVEDISLFNQWHQVLEGVDVIVHLAARAHVLSKNASSSEAIHAVQSINRNATLRFAKAAVAANVSRFVYISSIGVLGNATMVGEFTNNSAYDPKGAYAVSKMEAEIGLKEIAESSSIEVVIVRPPLVYGANAPGNFHRLMRLVDMGLPLPLGEMHAKKSMISLENLCNLLMSVITTQLPKYSQFVVSDSTDWSTAELVKVIAKYIGNKHPLISVPVPILMAVASLIGKKEDIRKLAVPLQVNGSETARILNWTPVQSPEDGVKEAVEYYLDNK